MLYGTNYCLFRTAREETSETLVLPTSQIPTSVFLSDTTPYLQAEFSVWPEADSGTICTPTATQYPEVYSVYLTRIQTRAGELRFTKNWREINSGDGFGYTLGTKVGELIYDGAGHWKGELTHPNDDYNSGSVFVSLSLRFCFPATVFVGKFGSDPNNLTHQVRQPPTAVGAGQGPSTMVLGGTWWQADNVCADTLHPDAFAGFPSWYYALPTQYTAGNLTIQTGDVTTVGPACRIYNSGLFFGYLDVFHQVLTPSVCQLSKPTSTFNALRWSYLADMSGRCLVDDEETIWCELSASNGLPVCQIGFGFPHAGYTDINGDPVDVFGFPKGTGLFTPNAYRDYRPISNTISVPHPEFEGTIAAPNPDGGWDWLDSNLMNRATVTTGFSGGTPVDSHVDEKYFAGVIPDQLTITPVE